MLTFLYALHFLVCFVLISVVLLQRGKGQDLGASLGGGSANTIFGSRGAGNFLTKITTASAIIFMGTSLSLSYLGYQSSDVRLFDQSEPFVPDGTAPKAEESGLEEVPAAADAAGAAAPAQATGDGGLVEIPSAAAERSAEEAAKTGGAGPSAALVEKSAAPTADEAAPNAAAPPTAAKAAAANQP